MNIGIDIDGVLLDTENYFRAYGELYDIDNFNKGVLYPEKLRMQERMGWTIEIFEKFVTDCMYDIMREAPLMPCVKEVLSRLRQMGHKLIVISARGSFTDVEKDIALDRFRKDGLEFDKICFTQNKLPACIENNIDVMIDDSAINVVPLSEGGVKCLYLREKFMPAIDNENVIEVDNWGEIFRYIVNINK